jgi:hypothetical protein
MKKRFKFTLAPILVLSLLAATFTGCAKKPVTPGGPPVDPKIALLGSINDVLFSLNEAKPLVCSLVPVACAGLGTGLDIAAKIRDAIAANNNPGAIAFISQLIPVLSQIVDKDINGLIAAQKTIILSALALANIGLHYLSKHLAEGVAAARDRNASVLARFNAEPVWGLLYKR